MGEKADNRKSPRADITLWVEEQRGQTVTFHHTGNISPTGVFFEGALPHPIGTKVRLRFSLPGREQAIETDGEVVRSLLKETRPGMAVRFVGLSADESKAIEDVVRKHGG